MSIEMMTDAATQVARPLAVEPAARSSAPERSSPQPDATEAAKVSLGSRGEMDELVKLVAQAPTEVGSTRFEDIALQVRDRTFEPGFDEMTEKILEELELLPDPPYRQDP